MSQHSIVPLLVALGFTLASPESKSVPLPLPLDIAAAAAAHCRCRRRCRRLPVPQSQPLPLPLALSPLPLPLRMARPQTDRPAWRGEVHEGLYSLAKARAPLLRARPRTWGEVSVALVADLAGTQITGTADLQLSRPDLENLAVDRLLSTSRGTSMPCPSAAPGAAAIAGWSSALTRRRRQRHLSWLLWMTSGLHFLPARMSQP